MASGNQLTMAVRLSEVAKELREHILFLSLKTDIFVYCIKREKLETYFDWLRIINNFGFSKALLEIY